MLNVADNPHKMVFLRLGERSRLILNALQILNSHVRLLHLVSILMDLADVGGSSCRSFGFVCEVLPAEMNSIVFKIDVPLKCK